MQKGRILDKETKLDLTKRVHRLVDRRVTIASMVDELDGMICTIVMEKVKESDELFNAVEQAIGKRLAERTVSIRNERDTEIAAAKVALVDLRKEFKDLKGKYEYLQQSLTEDTALAHSVRTIFSEARKCLGISDVKQILEDLS